MRYNVSLNVCTSPSYSHYFGLNVNNRFPETHCWGAIDYNNHLLESGQIIEVPNDKAINQKKTQHTANPVLKSTAASQLGRENMVSTEKI